LKLKRLLSFLIEEKRGTDLFSAVSG